jgi:uncharacterized protein with LGFP repeats
MSAGRARSGGSRSSTARLSLVSGVVVAAVATVLPGPASAADTGSAPAAARETPAQQVTARTSAGLTVENVAVPSVSSPAGGTSRTAAAAAALAPTRVRPFDLVGVTWRSGTTPVEPAVQVRLHLSGEWTGWQDLPYEHAEGPAAGEESTNREGTGPLWTGGANGVAVRLTSATGAAPADVQVVTIDPGDDPAALSRSGAATLARPGNGRPITGSPAFPSRPRAITRNEWGADPSLTESCDAPRYGRTARMVFVHHTVNANNYTAQEAPSIVRSIYAYHTQGQGWCDIGYNALIDRFGTVYVGRRGGFSKPVRGAHAGDYNTDTVGVSLIGNFEQVRPARAMKNALIRFIGWRLGTSYAPVKGRANVSGTRFARISGHRDAMATACPGRYVYAFLPALRSRTSDYLSQYRSPLARRAARLGKERTGPVWKGEAPVDGGFRTVFRNGVMYGRGKLGAHLIGGRALGAYRSAGGPEGRLGWPTADVRGPSPAGVRILLAQRGRIYLGTGGGPAALYGPTYRRYRAMGLEHSRLGLPVTGVTRTGVGERTRFRHGVIAWNRSTRRVTVSFS